MYAGVYRRRSAWQNNPAAADKPEPGTRDHLKSFANSARFTGYNNYSSSASSSSLGLGERERQRERERRIREAGHKPEGMEKTKEHI